MEFLDYRKPVKLLNDNWEYAPGAN